MFRSPICFSSVIPCFNVTVNVEPSPYTLLTVTVPFISSVNSLTIESPRPVPSIWRFFASSTRRNASNRYGSASFLIPIPVSEIEIISVVVLLSASLCSICRLIDPSEVYFTALFNRLMMICLMRTSSPYRTAGTSGSTLTLNSSPFSCALSQIIFTISESRSPTR